MGLILDTSILIQSERRGEAIEEILRQARAVLGEIDIALSAVSVVELTHGIYRARIDADRMRRSVFAEGVFHDLIVHPLTLEIAQLAGRIEGEQAAQGVSIGFEDLVIGAHGPTSRLRCRHAQRPPLPGHPRPQCGHALRGESSFFSRRF